MSQANRVAIYPLADRLDSEKLASRSQVCNPALSREQPNPTSDFPDEIRDRATPTYPIRYLHFRTRKNPQKNIPHRCLAYSTKGKRKNAESRMITRSLGQTPKTMRHHLRSIQHHQDLPLPPLSARRTMLTIRSQSEYSISNL